MKVIRTIMERNLAPVIVFSFSKKECEAYALQMSKLDFNSSKSLLFIHFSKNHLKYLFHFKAKKKNWLKKFSIMRSMFSVMKTKSCLRY